MTFDDQQCTLQLGLDKDRLLVLVHSRSWCLGEALWRAHVDRRGSDGFDSASGEASNYLL